MDDMGLPAHEFDQHIAWDIGARAVSLALSAKLDAPLFMQHYLRLVCASCRPLRSALPLPVSGRCQDRFGGHGRAMSGYPFSIANDGEPDPLQTSAVCVPNGLSFAADCPPRIILWR